MAKKKVAPVKKAAAKKAPVKTKKAAPKAAKAPAKSVKAGGKTIVKTAKAKSKPALKKVVAKKGIAKPSPARLPAGQVGPASGKIVSKAVSKTEPKKIKGPSEILSDAIVDGILEVKGRNIFFLNLKEIHNRVCDYFIICQADSNTQVNAIAGSVEEMVKKLTGERPYRKEGFENSEWILVDYVTVVVHVFQSEVRNFYNLESLWADAEITQIAFDK